MNRLATRTSIAFASLLLGLSAVRCGDDDSPAGPDSDDPANSSSALGLEEPFAGAESGISNLSALAFSPAGRLFVCSLNGRGDVHFNGDVFILDDTDGDGRADSSTVFADGLATPVGLAFHGDDVYVSTYGAIMVFTDTDGDDRADVRRELVSLPRFGMHVNNGIAIGPDDMLYLTLGSESNLEAGSSPLRSTILRCNLDGSDLTVFATGLRNPYDLAFNDEGELFATENGPDGDEINDLEAANPDRIDFPEELNHIVEGNHYGFPDTYGPPASDADGVGPIAEWITHSGAQGLVFNSSLRFPAFANHFFIAMYHAGRIDAVELLRTGDTYETVITEVIDFPCLPGQAYIQPTGHKDCIHMHPLDVAIGPEGNLFIAAFGIINSDLSPRIPGAIYKISTL